MGGPVQVFTKARMLAIEAGTIVSGVVQADGHLILTRHDGTTYDAGLVYPISATDTVKGIVELATSAETITGTDLVRAITAAGLKATLEIWKTDTLAAAAAAVPTSSDTVKGLVELATSAETNTGTDASRAVTPASLKGARDAGMFDTRYFTEAEITALLYAARGRQRVVPTAVSNCTVDPVTGEISSTAVQTFVVDLSAYSYDRYEIEVFCSTVGTNSYIRCLAAVSGAFIAATSYENFGGVYTGGTGAYTGFSATNGLYVGRGNTAASSESEFTLVGLHNSTKRTRALDCRSVDSIRGLVNQSEITNNTAYSQIGFALDSAGIVGSMKVRIWGVAA